MAKIMSSSEQIKMMKAIHGAATTAGTPILVNSRLCVPINTALINVENLFADDVPALEINKEAPLVISGGDTVYWDDGAKKVTKTAQGNTKCGMAVEDAASADTVAYIHLMRQV